MPKMAVGLPIASIAMLLTLVGIPLGLLGLLSLAVLYALGYVVAALALVPLGFLLVVLVL